MNMARIILLLLRIFFFGIIVVSWINIVYVHSIIMFLLAYESFYFEGLRRHRFLYKYQYIMIELLQEQSNKRDKDDQPNADLHSSSIVATYSSHHFCITPTHS